MEGFSREIYRSDHPNNIKAGGVCLYLNEGLANSRRVDLELLLEMVVTMIDIARKKVIFAVIYPVQEVKSLKILFLDCKIAITRITNEKPYAMVITWELNCRSSQWWAEDTKNPESSALDEILKTNNLYQLIKEPTNIRGEGMSCIDLIITDQSNLFVDSDVHPSLDEHCQHQIIYGQLSILVPNPPTYTRRV